MSRRLTLLATAAACTLSVLAAAGTASANRNTPDADCAGLSFVMPSTEAGTTITIIRNGAPVFNETNEVFGRSYDLSFPSPDRTVQQAWRVVVSGYSGTSVWTETVPPCVTPTTAATTTAVPPATTVTTSPPPATTVVASSSAPAPSTTVVVPPRNPAPIEVLPATGSSWVRPTLLAAVLLAGGAAAILGTRRW